MKSLETQPADRGTRLDAWLAGKFPEHSRARWQQLIREGRVLVDGVAHKPNHLLTGHEVVEYTIPPPETVELCPEEIPLDVLFEDRDLMAINKPPGLVVHPAPGHASGTLVNALLHHCKDLAGIGGELRPGIVHRLDRDTSGVLVVAKNEVAMTHLADQFKQRDVKKVYLAVVWGRFDRKRGTIETLVGRNPHNRKKMSATPATGRKAITHFRTLEVFPATSLIEVTIETGRTHQIRVHMAHQGHPVVGDRQYGRGRVQQLPLPVKRQMLHAHRLSLTHPRTKQALEFEAPPPKDMSELIESLKEAK